MISSRKTTEISNFPMPSHYPDFPSAKQVLEYLKSYSAHFKLDQHIQFNTDVAKIHPILDGSKWEVILGSGEKRIYKGVIICNGHDWDSYIPTYPGKPTLEIIHSRQYRNPEILKGKRVLVVGGGNSATDIACDAAQFAKSSQLSLRRGYWFIPRMIYGRPIAEMFIHWAPHWFQQIYIEIAIRVAYGDFTEYGLERPTHTLFEHPVSVADQLFHEIRKGRVRVKKDICRIDKNTVSFVDGSEEEIDLIVFGTGYKPSIPMAAHLISYEGRIAQLLHGVVHPRLKNLYVLGYGQARSGCGPLLHAGASTILKCVQTQEKLTYPIGRILIATGSRFPKPGKNSPDVIVDPHRAFAKGWLAPKFISSLPWFESILLNRKKYDPTKVHANISKSPILDAPSSSIYYRTWTFVADLLDIPLQ